MESIPHYIETGELSDMAYMELKNRALLFLTNRFFYVNVAFNISREHLAHDMVTNLLPQLRKYDASKSSLSSYVWFIFRNYLVRGLQSANTQSRKAELVLLDSYKDDTAVLILDNVAFRRSMERDVLATDDKEFICYALLYWQTNLGRYFYWGKGKQYKAAKRIIAILSKGETFAHKDMGAFIRYELGISRALFHLIVERMRAVNRMLYKKWVSGEQF